jgi:hypothetical protein
MTAQGAVPQTRALVAEHRALLALADTLRHHIALVPDVHEARWRAELAVRLAELRLRLDVHFVTEERGGFFERLAESDTAGAERLRTQHVRLRACFAHVAGQAEQSDVPDHVLAETVRGLLDELGAHEATENEALVRHLDGSLAAAD